MEKKIALIIIFFLYFWNSPSAQVICRFIFLFHLFHLYSFFSHTFAHQRQTNQWTVFYNMLCIYLNSIYIIDIYFSSSSVHHFYFCEYFWASSLMERFFFLGAIFINHFDENERNERTKESFLYFYFCIEWSINLMFCLVE